MHVSYRDQTLENERIKTENSELVKRNNFLEKELVMMLEIQKERDDAVFVKQELMKKFNYLESELAKERKILKTWTNSGKSTGQVFQLDKGGIGYTEEDELRFQNSVKARTELPSSYSEPVSFCAKPVMRDSEFDFGISNSKIQNKKEKLSKPIQNITKEVNIGLMTEKQLKHKLKEINSVNKEKKPRKNRNGKVGVNNRNNFKPIPNAPRKTCHNCGSTNHLANHCRKNKNINSLPVKTKVKNNNLRYKPQNPCYHCGSIWHKKLSHLNFNSIN